MPVKKIIAIGDSFLAGDELKSQSNTWPALFAQNHNLEYQCLAAGGHSIQFVVRTLFESLMNNAERCLYVLHWPSAIRYEYNDLNNDTWVQINPNNILNGNVGSEQVQKIYYQYQNSLLGDKWHALLMIWSAVQALRQSHHAYSMTATDDFLFDKEHHNPPYVQFLQDHLRHQLTWFEGLPFHQWSDKNGYAKGPEGHPLEHAHQAATLYLENQYNKLLS